MGERIRFLRIPNINNVIPKAAAKIKHSVIVLADAFSIAVFLNFRALSAAVTMMASTPLTASCSSFVYCSTSSLDGTCPELAISRIRRPDWDQASTIARIFFILSVIGAVLSTLFPSMSLITCSTSVRFAVSSAESGVL